MKNAITALNDGPLKLESDTQVLYRSDETVETKHVVSLCRCGLSKNKPFCDGAHRAAGFSDERLIEKEAVQHYPGEQASISFNRSICSGAARCVKGLPSVFSSESSEDWIAPDNDSLENVKAAVANCPSGAMSLQIEGQVIAPTETTKPQISIVPNGPLNVQGIKLIDRQPATNARPEQYALCRCGLSKNKPYCDYSHAEQGWQDGS